MTEKIRDYLARELIWLDSGNPLYPYTADVAQKSYTIRINNFPEAPLYTLIVDGHEVADFDDWPEQWVRPAAKKMGSPHGNDPGINDLQDSISSVGNDRLIESDSTDTSTSIDKWQQYPASYILHHGQMCCRIAREWVLGTDFSQLGVGGIFTGPRWLGQWYGWGPSYWPIFWCEAIKQKTLDSGALAAMAREIFIARGIRSFPVQMIQIFNVESTQHWYKNWAGDDGSVHWIEGALIYHEGCAIVVSDNEIRIWDPTVSRWIDSKQVGGYGGVVALRVITLQEDAFNSFKWGPHRVIPNEWYKTAEGLEEVEGAVMRFEQERIQRL